MKIEISKTENVKIYIAGDFKAIKEIAQSYCDCVGFCVSIWDCDYIYTGGNERGVVVNLINYPRFPKSKQEIFKHAFDLAILIKDGANQESFSIETSEQTFWYSWRK